MKTPELQKLACDKLYYTTTVHLFSLSFGFTNNERSPPALTYTKEGENEVAMPLGIRKI